MGITSLWQRVLHKIWKWWPRRGGPYDRRPSPPRLVLRERVFDVRIGPQYRRGVFIDVQNLYWGMRSFHPQAWIDYWQLQHFLRQDGATVTLSAFTYYDPDNKSQVDFIHALSLMGYRVVARPLRRLASGAVKGDIDLELALAVLDEAPYLDEIVLVTGDGDFVPLVNRLVQQGKLVKVIGPDKVTAPELIWACHEFINLSQIEGVVMVGEKTKSAASPPATDNEGDKDTET